MRTDRQPDMAKLIVAFAIFGTRLRKELACIIFMVCNGMSGSSSAVDLAVLACRERQSDENCQLEQSVSWPTFYSAFPEYY